MSSFPNLDHLLDRLPAERTVMVLHQPRALLTRTQMAARQEDRIDLLLPADCAKLSFLIRMLELHGSLAKAFSFFELACVDVAIFDVFHPALPTRLISRPLTVIVVAVGIFHRTSAAFPACDKVALVSIAR